MSHTTESHSTQEVVILRQMVVDLTNRIKILEEQTSNSVKLITSNFLFLFILFLYLFFTFQFLNTKYKKQSKK